MAVVFDAKAARQIIGWGQGKSLVVPTEWKSTHAHQLARKWAHRQGRPDPDATVEQGLAMVVEAKRKDPNKVLFKSPNRLLVAVLDREDAFLKTAIPHIQSYLPPHTPVRASVHLAVFLPAYAFAWENSIVVDVTWDWKGDPDRVLNLLVHELYHVGFGVYNRGPAPNEAQTAAALRNNILWEIQNEGMATYVAYLARPQGLLFDDYQLLDDATVVRALFSAVRGLLEMATRDSEARSAIREQMWDLGVEQRAFYVVGAHMCQQIERKLGRSTLVSTVSEGAMSFFDAYAETSPPPELSVE